MNPQILQFLQRILVTAVTVVLALVVLTAFLRIIRPPEVTASPVTSGSATTTIVPGDQSATTTTTVATESEPGEEQPPVVDAVCEEPAPTASGGTVLRVYFNCGNGPVPTPDTFVYRVVPETDLVLTTTLQQLVTGPDEEEAALGFRSVFNSETSRTFASVSINNGRAIVDFVDLEGIESLSDGTRSDFFLSNLNTNVFQFDTINAVEYRLGGSCDAFYALLTQDTCTTVTRQAFRQQSNAYRQG